MKAIYTIIFSLLCLCVSVIAQKVSFAYDEAGNRISRELVIVQSVRPLSLASVNPSYYDMLDDASIKISYDTDGCINIEITNFNENMHGHISVYSVSGIVLFSTEIHQALTTVELGNQPNGIYILGIEINGQQLSWKIIKK